jgi:hypothetical protein
MTAASVHRQVEGGVNLPHHGDIAVRRPTMSMRAIAAWERWPILAFGLPALALAGLMLVRPQWQIPDDSHQFVMVAIWSKLVLRQDLQPIANTLPVLVAVIALFSAGIALALALIEPPQPSVRRLRRALLLGAWSALYLFQLRPWYLSALPSGPLALLDVLAHVIGAWAVAELTGFLATYPQPADIERLRAQMRESLITPTDATRFVKSRYAALAAMDAWLARAFALVGLRLQPDFGSEQSVERNSRIQAKLLGLAAGSGLRAVCLVLGAIDGICFVLAHGDDAFDTAAMMLALPSVFIPFVGAGSLHANYRFGSDEDRRRIGWIYLGPTFGFILASVVYFGLMLWFLASSSYEPRVFSVPVPALWLASTMLFFPALIASFVLGLAFAIFYRGSLNPRLMIRRGAVVALSGLLLTALFVSVEGLVSSQIMLRFGMPSSTGAIIAGTLAAVMFAPLHKRVDRGVEHLLGRLMPIAETNQTAAGETAPNVSTG